MRGGRHGLLTRAATLATAAAVAVIWASAAASPAGAKTVSPDKYAKSLCGALRDVFEAHEEFNETYSALPVVDAVNFQTQVIEVVNILLADLETAAAKLRKLKPDITRGKRVSSHFSDYLGEQVTAVTAARDAFALADPNGVAIASDVTAFEIDVTMAVQPSSDPFAKIRSGELLEAFEEEPSCKGVVTVF